MVAIQMMSASITEYPIIFGTAISAKGHTGRPTADDYFHILAGTQLAYEPVVRTVPYRTVRAKILSALCRPDHSGSRLPASKKTYKRSPN